MSAGLSQPVVAGTSCRQKTSISKETVQATQSYWQPLFIRAPDAGSPRRAWQKRWRPEQHLKPSCFPHAKITISSAHRQVLIYEHQNCQQFLNNWPAICALLRTRPSFLATRPLVEAKMQIDRLLGKGPSPAQGSGTAGHPVQAPPHPVDVIVPVYRQRQMQAVRGDRAGKRCQTSLSPHRHQRAPAQSRKLRREPDAKRRTPGSRICWKMRTTSVFVGTVSRA